MIVLHLPPRHRPDFKWPRGPVYRGQVEKLLARLGHESLSCIGDVVTRTCLRAGLKPTLTAVDGATRRRSEDVTDTLSLARRLGMPIRRVRNPPGALSLDAIESVCAALQSRRPTLLLVDGEEDLLALPAIACSPPGGLVVYGAPGLGAVVVRVTLLKARDAQQRILSLEPGLV